MGGSIQVDSVPGQGSVFTVRLPYQPGRPAPAPEVHPIALPAGSLPLAGLKILVAEDNEINQEIMQANLSDDGASVTLVDNGQLAVDAVRNNPPGSFDVVLMDVQMPVLSGLDAARQIKQLAPDLPVIGQTAHALAQDRADCLAAGMVGYIAKPINPQLLNALILKHTPAAH